MKNIFDKKTRIIVVLLIFVILLVNTAVASYVSSIGPEPRVADPNTKFHRIYVLGNGNNEEEDEDLLDDYEELKGDLEDEDNQADGSTSQTFIKPTKTQLKNYIDDLKDVAQPGDEVTLYFGAHGNRDVVRLSDGQFLYASELANWLEGFAYCVTIVVIMDSCYGGSFIDDIGEDDHTAVIGVKGTCPFDGGAFVETFTEEIADQAGEQEADANDDGIVTAEELKNCLRNKDWDLGIPSSSTTVRNGKSKCLNCVLPTIIVEPPEVNPGDPVIVTGENFEPVSDTTFILYTPDMESVDLYSTMTSEMGTFAVTFDIPYVPSWLVVMDSEGYWTWHRFYGTPPTAPTIGGPSSGKPGTEYDYTFTSTDVDIDLGDQVHYYIDWGDGDVEAWKGPFEPGQPATFSHTWDEKGTYEIRARAKDNLDDKSDWATLDVTMPRNRAINTPLFNFLQNHPILFQLFQRFLSL